MRLAPVLSLHAAASPPPRCELFAELTLVPPGGQLGQLFQQYLMLQVVAITIAGGLFFLVRPDGPLWRFSAPDVELPERMRPESRWSEVICRPAGWLARCEITGERGSLAAALLPSQAVGLDVSLAFSQAGTANECFLLRPSRLLEPSGRWRFDDDLADIDGSSTLEWRIRCPVGISSGEETLVPAGTTLYFSARLSESEKMSDAARRAASLRGVADTAGFELTDGRVSVLKGSGPWGGELNLATGATQLVEVGTFAAAAVSS